MYRVIIMALLLPCSIGAMHDHLIIDAIRNNENIDIDQLEDILGTPNAQFSERVATAVYHFGMSGQRIYLTNLLNDNQEAMLLPYFKYFFFWLLFVGNPIITSDK